MKNGIKLAYRKKLVLSIFAVVVVPYLLFAAFYLRYVINENRQDLFEQQQGQMSRNVDEALQLFSVCTQKLAMAENDSVLQNYLVQGTDKLSELVTLRYYLLNYYNSMILSNPWTDVTIYSLNPGVIPIECIRPAEELAPDILEECLSISPDSERFLFRVEPEDGLDASKPGQITFYKANKRINGVPFAITKMTLDIGRLEKIFNSYSLKNTGMSFYIYDSAVIGLTSGLFPGENSQKEMVPFKDGAYLISRVEWTGKRFAANTLLMESGREPGDLGAFSYPYGLFVSTIPNEGIYDGTGIAALFLLLLLVFIAFTVFFISRQLTKKLYEVIDRIKTLYVTENSSHALQESFGESDEFSMINGKLAEMLEELKNHYEKIRIYSLEKKELEAQLLQDLINPHFLYNTLDSIKWLSKDSKVIEAVDSLILYYRTSLSRGKTYIPVSEELRVVEEYLKLQRFAYESDFRYEIHASKEVLSRLTLRHILQPFVENAVLHGIDKSGAKGLIQVLVHLAEDGIHFEIRDNGCGIKEERLVALNSGRDEGEGGYGVINVKKRIRNIFGEPYDVVIHSTLNEGTSIRIVIPADIHSAGSV